MENKAPLVVCIGRLVAQKGLHLIIHAIKRVEELVSIPLLLIVAEMCSSLSLSHSGVGNCVWLTMSYNSEQAFPSYLFVITEQNDGYHRMTPSD